MDDGALIAAETEMVQIVENWAWLTCRLVRIRTVGDHLELDVVVELTGRVESFPNLLESAVGRDLTIMLKGTMPALTAGDRFQIKARRSGPVGTWGDPATLLRVD